MLDPNLLKPFKKITREDEQISSHLLTALRGREIRSILDVGSGPGLISERFRQAYPKCDIEIVEPNMDYTYPFAQRVHRHNFEDLHLVEHHFDLILMSHVIGHFPLTNRGELIAGALQNLTSNGLLIIVENAPCEPFWSLNLAIANYQSAQYVIDFADLVGAMQRQNAAIHIEDRKIPLFMGHEPEEQSRMLNVLFPEPFCARTRAIIHANLHTLMKDGVFELSQRFITASQPLDQIIPVLTISSKARTDLRL